MYRVEPRAFSGTNCVKILGLKTRRLMCHVMRYVDYSQITDYDWLLPVQFGLALKRRVACPE